VTGRRGGTPSARDGQVLVRVKAAGINPGEAVIRTGRWRSCSRRRSRPGRAATWRITTIR
ncbi:MAG TPA: hypothetical protein VJ418_17760, partial [Streptosporangiaceae bacterium]|nr:hypothetical protein [Streptosporangiaceae bacterium]